MKARITKTSNIIAIFVEYTNNEVTMDKNEARIRATELVDQMTLEEMVSQLRYDAPAIERLNIPEYNWWNEGLHGVARAGTATSFPQSIGLGATFDKDIMEVIGDIISTEQRAKYNEFSRRGDRDIYKGLTIWSPNINVFRDPRWGRGQETYGEDPLLISEMAIRFIDGIQGDGKYMKGAACAKHMAVHSGPENLRHQFDAVASKKDMAETYLPQFEECIKRANVESVMGAYNRVNGVPACAHEELINLIRDDWGFDGHFVSDCWAIRDFHEGHRVTKTPEDSAAMALKAGCDLNCGCTYQKLLKAIKSGKVSKDYARISAIRLFTTRFILGMFDETEFDSLGYQDVEAPEHLEVAKKASDECIVLLKNNGALPLKKDIKNIAVIGPNAYSAKALIGNYHGTSARNVTVLDGIRQVFDNSRVYYSEGADLTNKKPDPLSREYHIIAEAKTVTDMSDAVVLVLGLNEDFEGEEGDEGNMFASGDKVDLQYPECQRRLMEEVCTEAKKKGIPVILVSMTGSAMDMRYADENCDAIIQAWYPGAFGGLSVAKVLCGDVNPSGKLPVTVYKTTEELPDFTDYSMKGRTYRYIETEPLYPFGYGLNYSNSDVVSAKVIDKNDDGVKIEVELKNDSSVDVTEVVQAYVKNEDSNETLHPHLASFERVSIKGNQGATAVLTVPNKAFTVIDDDGKRIEVSKSKIYIGLGQPDERTKALTGKTIITIEV